MKTKTVTIPTTGEEIEVKIPLGIDSETFDLAIEHMEKVDDPDRKVQWNAVVSVVKVICTAPEDFNWRKADIDNVWEIMVEDIKPMFEKFRARVPGAVDTGGVSVPANPKRGDRRKSLPRHNRPKLSETPGDSGPA